MKHPPIEGMHLPRDTFRATLEHWSKFVDEVSNVFEFTIDTGETNERNLIQLAQRIHDHPAEVATFDFLFKVGVYLRFYRGDNCVDLFIADRSLPTGYLEAFPHFLAIEWLTLTVLLDHLDGHFFQPFIGGVSPFAIQALTAPTDGKTIVAGSRVNDSIVISTTKRASHGRADSLWLAENPCFP